MTSTRAVARAFFSGSAGVGDGAAVVGGGVAEAGASVALASGLFTVDGGLLRLASTRSYAMMDTPPSSATIKTTMTMVWFLWWSR